MKFLAAATFALATLFASSQSHAEVITSNAPDLTLAPVADATLWNDPLYGLVYTTDVILVGPSVQGVLKFDADAVTAPVAKATLSLRAFGPIMWAYYTDVYGYVAGDTTMLESDRNAGTLLGRIMLPFNVTPGDEFQIDVTDFVSKAKGPFLAFSLRTLDDVGSDLYTAIRDADGRTPSQLLIEYGDALPPSDVPEPAPAALFLAAMAAFAIARRQANKSH